MNGRFLAVGLLAWVGVVVVVSALIWAVIGHAGQEVGVGSSPVAAGSPLVSQPTDSAAGPTIAASPTQRPHAPRSASFAPSSTAAEPSPTSAAPRPTRTSSAASRPHTTSPAPKRVWRVGTWQGPPGTVTVACRGPEADLRSASPRDGYRVEVSKGPDRIDVKFESSSREVRVTARCVGGQPRFSTEGESSDD